MMIELPTLTEIGGLTIFPKEYEQDETVFFHGTSVVYAPHIEQYGLFPNHKPLTPHFYTLLALADKVYFHTYNDSEFSVFNKVYKDAFNYFNSFTRISFSAVSSAAAYYSVNRPGGQGLRHLINLKSQLNCLSAAFMESNGLNTSQIHKQGFETVDAEIANIRESNGVVYAFKFEKADQSNLDYAKHGFHSVLLSHAEVPALKIIGKVVVDKQTHFEKELVTKSNEETLRLGVQRQTTSFIKGIMQLNIERIPIREYLPE